MPIELVLDASVSLAWFLKESSERAAYAAAVSAIAADGAILHVPVQWGIDTATDKRPKCTTCWCSVPSGTWREGPSG